MIKHTGVMLPRGIPIGAHKQIVRIRVIYTYMHYVILHYARMLSLQAIRLVLQGGIPPTSVISINWHLPTCLAIVDASIFVHLSTLPFFLRYQFWAFFREITSKSWLIAPVFHLWYSISITPWSFHEVVATWDRLCAPLKIPASGTL